MVKWIKPKKETPIGFFSNGYEVCCGGSDIDGKDGITAADARLILRYSVKLETKFPVEP